MINPAQPAIELVVVAVALVLSRSVGGTSRLRLVLGFAALSGLSNLAPRFWAAANDTNSLGFAVGAGLRNLAGEEVFARLGVQSIAWYLLRNVRGRAALAVVASSLVFEFWHNPFERPLFLNFTASAVFGWAYHRRGYEVAAVGHCVADWLVIGLFPRLLSGA